VVIALVVLLVALMFDMLPHDLARTLLEVVERSPVVVDLTTSSSILLPYAYTLSNVYSRERRLYLILAPWEGSAAALSFASHFI
jgi:hypothetical protein